MTAKSSSNDLPALACIFLSCVSIALSTLFMMSPRSSTYVLNKNQNSFRAKMGPDEADSNNGRRHGFTEGQTAIRPGLIS
jgi:hypothetical protein